MTDLPDLLPCPFCGEMPTFTESGRVTCRNKNCDVYVITNDGDLFREAQWNTRAAQRWIPVTERLPEENRLVQVYNGSVTCGILREPQIIGGGWMIAFDYSGVLEFQFPVTHWMPLPQPPEVK